MILSRCKLTASNESLKKQVLFVKNVTWKLRSALEELFGALPSLDDLSQQQKIDNIRDELRSSAMDVVADLCISMSKIYDDVMSTHVPVLLDGELYHDF